MALNSPHKLTREKFYNFRKKINPFFKKNIHTTHEHTHIYTQKSKCHVPYWFHNASFTVMVQLCNALDVA